jgi:hypothetical protein
VFRIRRVSHSGTLTIGRRRPKERSATATISRWVRISGPASSYRALAAASAQGPPGSAAITHAATSSALIG